MKRDNLILLLAGLLALGIGIFLIFSDSNMEKSYTGTTTATVLGYREEEHYNGDFYVLEYYPLVKYTAEGTEYEAYYSQCYSNLPYEIGQEIQIEYDPSHPDKFNIAGERRGFGSAVWMVPVGAGMAVAGLWKHWKEKKEEEEKAGRMQG